MLRERIMRASYQVHWPHAAPFLRGCDSPDVGCYFFNRVLKEFADALRPIGAFVENFNDRLQPLRVGLGKSRQPG